MVWLAITKSGKLVDVSGAKERPMMLPPCSSWDMPAWLSIEEVMSEQAYLSERVTDLTEALTACRGQWIHSVHRQRCLAVLEELDQYPCTVPEHDYCRKQQACDVADVPKEKL